MANADKIRVLLIGDVVGRVGRRLIREQLPKVIKEISPNIIIANVENAAGGIGLVPKIVDELSSYGVDILTSGNHIFSKKEIMNVMDKYTNLLRPLNYPPGVPGRGSLIFHKDNFSIGVVNLCGRVFMDELDCPFRVGLPEVERLREQTKVIVVDMHAEATSEKIAMGWYLDGKVSAVIGTHTHVQTADEKILPNGTAYITDVGMTGSVDSVIGIKKEIIIKHYLTNINFRMEVAEGSGQFCAVIIDINPVSGKAISIERVCRADEGI